MESKSKKFYRLFHSEFISPIEIDTLGDLQVNMTEDGSAIRYKTESRRPSEWETQDMAVEGDAKVVETSKQHDESDRDIDEVLEPPSIPRTDPSFLREAWREKPIRKLALPPAPCTTDKESSLFIRIFRIGGDFEMKLYDRNLGVMHIMTNYDLTLFIWHIPRNPKKQKSMNVFELLTAELQGGEIVLGTMRDTTAIRLTVTASNRVEQLVGDLSFADMRKKTELWFKAFERLVQMKLQPSVYRS